MILKVEATRQSEALQRQGEIDSAGKKYVPGEKLPKLARYCQGKGSHQ